MESCNKIIDRMVNKEIYNTIFYIDIQRLLYMVCCNSYDGYDYGGPVQRNIDNSHLRDIIEYYKKCINNDNFIFPNNIILCKLNNKYLIVDGQYRFSALLNLTKQGIKIKVKIPILILKIDSIKEYTDIFYSINKSKPVLLYDNIENWINVLKRFENLCVIIIHHISVNQTIQEFQI